MIRWAVLVLVVVAMTGCIDYDAMIKKFLPEDVDAVARSYIKNAADNRVNLIIQQIPTTDRTLEVREMLRQISAYMQKGGLVKITTAGIHSNTVNGVTTYNVTYELQYQQAWQVADLQLVRQGGSIILKGFHVNDLPASLTELNRFTFRGKGFRHYLFFTLNIVYLVFVCSVFFLCLRTQNLRRKWLWALVCLGGIVEVWFNWTTGEWGLKALSFGFKISSFASPYPYMPSILAFYIPVGAVAFLVKRARTRNCPAMSAEDTVRIGAETIGNAEGAGQHN